LQELDRLKDDFVSTVTHELRTPLTSIRAFSEILHDNPDLDPAERQRFLALVIRESERLTRLINQVLDLAKIESGLAEWRTAELDLREIVLEAVNATSALFGAKGVSVTTRLATSVAPVRADRDRLMQVLLNLLSNAVKFCPPETGRVEVRLADAAGGVRIDVEDNGIGISAENQALIFEKFAVGDHLKAVKHGLGLAICRRTWATGGASGGERARARLRVLHSPRAAGGSAGRLWRTPEAPVAKRVLIAEDEPSIVTSLSSDAPAGTRADRGRRARRSSSCPSSGRTWSCWTSCPRRSAGARARSAPTPARRDPGAHAHGKGHSATRSGTRRARSRFARMTWCARWPTSDRRIAPTPFAGV
jgi:hypothetical protein